MAAVPAAIEARTVSPEQLYETMEPIEGIKVELLDGRLVMTGSPGPDHNWIVWRLVLALVDSAKANAWGLLQTTTVHVRATRDRLQPDLVVTVPDAPRYDESELYADGALLVAEVVSAGTGHDGRVRKRRAYARGRVPLYLLIDPEGNQPSVNLYTDPGPDNYRSRTRGGPGEEITLPKPFGIAIPVTDLLG